ncbi:hypothetical protein BC831DRAFT_514730 [Entophlyctis helioformis]|nr:hypothetical protein BC831DRAFT_514730 [Entophlyctis helioformis]
MTLTPAATAAAAAAAAASTPTPAHTHTPMATAAPARQVSASSGKHKAAASKTAAHAKTNAGSQNGRNNSNGNTNGSANSNTNGSKSWTKGELEALAQFTVPPANPNRVPPARSLVFVDPDDAHAPYWWPAMVVPPHELELFRRSVESDVDQPGPGQCLVCYFEDGSFSVVAESDTLPLCPFQAPYTSYVAGPSADAFRKDKAVVLATLYWETGSFPPYFSWLNTAPREKRTRSLSLCLADPELLPLAPSAPSAPSSASTASTTSTTTASTTNSAKARKSAHKTGSPTASTSPPTKKIKLESGHLAASSRRLSSSSAPASASASASAPAPAASSIQQHMPSPTDVAMSAHYNSNHSQSHHPYASPSTSSSSSISTSSSSARSAATLSPPPVPVVAAQQPHIDAHTHAQQRHAVTSVSDLIMRTSLPSPDRSVTECESDSSSVTFMSSASAAANATTASLPRLLSARAEETLASRQQGDTASGSNSNTRWAMSATVSVSIRSASGRTLCPSPAAYTMCKKRRWLDRHAQSTNALQSPSPSETSPQSPQS